MGGCTDTGRTSNTDVVSVADELLREWENERGDEIHGRDHACVEFGIPARLIDAAPAEARVAGGSALFARACENNRALPRQRGAPVRRSFPVCLASLACERTCHAYYPGASVVLVQEDAHPHVL